jgi:hypothetical protein
MSALKPRKRTPPGFHGPLQHLERRKNAALFLPFMPSKTAQVEGARIEGYRSSFVRKRFYYLRYRIYTKVPPLFRH